MLAKPEYFSPPDEVCCWPGRRGGAADLPGHQRRLAGTWQRAIGKLLPVGAVAELLTGTGRRGGAAAGSEVVQYHREENPGKDASTEEQLRDACRV